jgi:hypothetical protein
MARSNGISRDVAPRVITEFVGKLVSIKAKFKVRFDAHDVLLRRASWKHLVDCQQSLFGSCVPIRNAPQNGQTSGFSLERLLSGP